MYLFHLLDMQGFAWNDKDAAKESGKLWPDPIVDVHVTTLLGLETP